jgi:hypothetical protein
MKLAWAFAVLLMAPGAHAQVSGIPPELVAYFNDIEIDMGVKRLGTPVLGWLEEDDTRVLTIPVSSNEITYLQIVCDFYCETISAHAETVDGKTINHDGADTAEPVLVIPAGSGAQVSVALTMGYCDEWECQFAIQAFVR